MTQGVRVGGSSGEGWYGHGVVVTEGQRATAHDQDAHRGRLPPRRGFGGPGAKVSQGKAQAKCANSKAQTNAAAMKPAKSAASPASTAWRARLTPTEPK